MGLKFIDLFAGVGGIRLGFNNVFKDSTCVFSSEINKFSKITYTANFKDTPKGDINIIENRHIPRHDVILAGFPCQAFSIAGLRKGFKDDRGNLFLQIIRIAKFHKPNILLLENVKGLLSQDKGNTFKVIITMLEELGYRVHYKVLNALDFNLPQNRERVYIVCFLEKGVDFRFPIPKGSYTTVQSVLEDKVDQKYTISDKLWKWHVKRKEINRLNGKMWGYTLVKPSDTHTKTITARYHKDGQEALLYQDNLNPRKLTPREVARLQGFPDTFTFPVSDTQAYTQLGNSVPVKVIEEIAKEIKKALDRDRVISKHTLKQSTHNDTTGILDTN